MNKSHTPTQGSGEHWHRFRMFEGGMFVGWMEKQGCKQMEAVDELLLYWSIRLWDWLKKMKCKTIAPLHPEDAQSALQHRLHPHAHSHLLAEATPGVLVKADTSIQLVGVIAWSFDMSITVTVWAVCYLFLIILKSATNYRILMILGHSLGSVQPTLTCMVNASDVTLSCWKHLL